MTGLAAVRSGGPGDPARLGAGLLAREAPAHPSAGRFPGPGRAGRCGGMALVDEGASWRR